MSIATEISRLQGAKADIKTAIEGKGVSVPSSALLDTYPDYIDAIQQGGGGEEHTYTGHVDTAGLTALGWDAEDIQWLQDHVWWDAEDDAYWAVSEANLAFGPNGATPLTWANRASIKTNPDVRYFPKFDPSPSSNTSWSQLFYDYKSLCAIPTHGWDVSKVNNLYNAFGYCTCLRSVGDLSGWDVSNVTQPNYLFNSCYCLITPGDLSGWNMANARYFNYMFFGCYALKFVGDLSEWNTSSLTGLSNMFNSCYNLKSIGDLSGWDVSGVTGFDSVFAGCYRLVSLNLSDWNTGAVTRMDAMFSNCCSLVSVGDLSGWDVSKVTRMDSMFNACSSLVSLGDVSEWDTSACTNMNSTFNYCSSLIIDLSNWDTSRMTQASPMLRRLLATPVLDLSNWDLSACTNPGTSSGNSIFAECASTYVLKLGSKFFAGSITTFYFQGLVSWTRDSIYESLYTNQTLRDTSSTAVTIHLAITAYDRLSQQDRDDIATKNITLMRN